MMSSRKSHGKTFILATAGVAVLAWAGITFLPTDSANAKVEKPQHSSGTVACGGYYTSDQQHTLRWVFRNHNDTAINITGFRVYDWDGAKVWDSDAHGELPPRDRNRLIGPPPVDSKTLPAHATAWYGSEDLYGLGVFLEHPESSTPPAHLRNHVMVHVDWEAATPDTPVDALAGTTVRHLYLNPGKSDPWGRSTSACRDI